MRAMYEQYWNLTCRPFESHFSPAFFFDSETHQAARLKLRYLIENRLGTGVLCGEIGTGKTAVAAVLQHELAETCGPLAHLSFRKCPQPLSSLTWRRNSALRKRTMPDRESIGR